jgi:Ca2+-transporting ATPase
MLSIILTSIFSKRTFGDYIETVSIFIAVLIVSIVQTQTEYAQQKSFREINKLKNAFEVNVLRGGLEVQIKSTEVLKGDILVLKSGDAVCADCLYIRGQDLKVNNSSQTGESEAILVNDESPFMYAGTAIETGFGQALVISIGGHTRSGCMMTTIQDLEEAGKDQLTPLQQKLEGVAKILTYIGAIGAAITFLVLLGFWIKDVIQPDVKWDIMSRDIVSKVMIALSIFICAVPEGLPLAVTISLGFSMKRMMDDNNFVRHLSACETMGGCTAICSDKTGTLTQNVMTVVRFYEVGSEPQSALPPQVSEAAKGLWSAAIAVNSTAFETPVTKRRQVGGVIETTTTNEFVGSSSECALLQMVERWGVDYQAVRQSHKVLHVHEFSSGRKKMSTVVAHGDGCRVYMKGGPDFCLGLCTHFLTAAGERQPLTETAKAEVMRTLTQFAEQSLRTMLVAFRDLTAMRDEWKVAENVERELTIIGIVGIQDPLRPEVIHAVNNCRTAGVVVRMITGDFITTARAIAKECGILDEEQGETVIEGEEFARLDKLELLRRVPNLRVMARSSPMDKLRLVAFLEECGEVVAATGDGSNDSPALKQADVGLSMGKCGTELAKMASDIVILDDNFNSIVSALKWGRCVYDNIRSFLSFQLTVNFSAMIIAFVGSCALEDSPLKTIQLLWVNLIMDSLGALALATRGPTDNLLKRPPYGRDDNMINNVIIRNIIGQVLYQTAVLVTLLFRYESIFVPADDAETIAQLSDATARPKLMSGLIFNTLVVMQVFNLPNTRIAAQDMPFFEGLFTNKYFTAIFIAIGAVQFLIVHFAGVPFSLLRQNGIQWAIAVGFGFGSLIIGFFIRLIPLPDHTAEKLAALRMERHEKIIESYTGMSFQNQFKRHINAKGELVGEGGDESEKSGGDIPDI